MKVKKATPGGTHTVPSHSGHVGFICSWCKTAAKMVKKLFLLFNLKVKVIFAEGLHTSHHAFWESQVTSHKLQHVGLVLTQECGVNHLLINFLILNLMRNEYYFSFTSKSFWEMISMHTQNQPDYRRLVLSAQWHSDLSHFKEMILENISMVKSSFLHVNWGELGYLWSAL